ncbi:C6 transcription factor RosA-like [Penicillium malachiteum]|uniref:C6 transcription factor RosA-like n=1 Tax=Penicillium malachiteum TaxID=1324776 RepID=UPI0025485FE0|nr:C6 transcription factor RosA-like [Penicillium malachiteum]KAJ5737312.1 C6 transcription factor RosA-like [Penicillium malachiteum]
MTRRSRRPHTKSFNGCSTCKQRHVRCDQNRPECHNCNKRGVRCGYLDRPPIMGKHSSSGYSTPLVHPNTEAVVEQWHRTGIPPFIELVQCVPTGWSRLSKGDLWLVHNLTSISVHLHRQGLGDCTVWTPKLPTLLSIAMSNDFVMSSILGFSAFLMAHLTQKREYKVLGFRYRSMAFNGFRSALKSFPSTNYDGLLAASVLLSWQAPDRASWITMQQSISTVLQSVESLWKPQSEIVQLVRSHRALPLPSSCFQPNCHFYYLDQTIRALQTNIDLVSHIPPNSDQLRRLIQFLNRFRSEFLNQTPDMIFEELQTLRRWIFWLPISMFRDSGLDLITLAVLAQFFVASVVLLPFYPNAIETGDAFLCALSIGPIKEISRILAARCTPDPLSINHPLGALLMQFPKSILKNYSCCVFSRQHSLGKIYSYHANPYAMLQAYPSQADHPTSVAPSFLTATQLTQQNMRSDVAPISTLSQSPIYSQLSYTAFNRQVDLEEFDPSSGLHYPLHVCDTGGIDAVYTTNTLTHIGG